MTGQDIITAFELQVDDNTELSTDEELLLLNRIYRKVNSDRPWEYTKKAFEGVQSTTIPTVSLPSDFKYFVANHNHSSEDHFAKGPVVFVGTNYEPYEVVSWSDRRQYRNQTNKAYADISAGTLVFTTQPIAANPIEYDYHATLPALTLATSPVFNADFHEILVFGMASDDFVQQLSDKARSYAPENTQKYTDMLQQMAYWNANLIQI